MPGLVSWLALIVFVIVLLVGAALAFVVGLTLWSALCTGSVFLFRPKGRRWPWILGSIPLYIPIYLGAGTALVWQIVAALPASYFEYAFDMPMPASVQVHEADLDAWADYEEISLHFTATPADIRAITARGLTLDPGYGAQQPTPFTPPNRSGPLAWSQLEVYTGGSPNQRFHSEEAVLIYDPVTGEAWYTYDGFD